MKNISPLSLLPASIALAALISSSRADSVLDTRSTPSTAFSSTRGAVGNVWQAYEFQTGSVEETIRSIVLDIDETNAPYLWSYVTIDIRDASGANSAPGALLGSYALTQIDSYASFNCETGGIALLPSSDYYLVLNCTAPNLFPGTGPRYWSTYSPVYTAGGPNDSAGYSFADQIATSGNSGADWNVFEYDHVPFISLDTNPIVTPEPSAAMLSGIFALGLCMRRSRAR